MKLTDDAETTGLDLAHLNILRYVPVVCLFKVHAPERISSWFIGELTLAHGARIHNVLDGEEGENLGLVGGLHSVLKTV